MSVAIGASVYECWPAILRWLAKARRSEEPELGDRCLYLSVLAAICEGAHKRSNIGRTLGRPDSVLSHPLDMLERVQLIRKVDDALRSRRPLYQVTEPLLRLDITPFFPSP
jgi:hypothetical protein